ncbi:hypothetical protein, partial [Aquimarina gracilis]
NLVDFRLEVLDSQWSSMDRSWMESNREFLTPLLDFKNAGGQESFAKKLQDAVKSKELNEVVGLQILYYINQNDVSDEAVDRANRAIDIFEVYPNANPFLSADCRSFEYAQPPGALQRACAVKNFNHTFYTAGIRSNGSPYAGDISVPQDLIYFTAPSWMTNSQAANATAAAVSAAINETDIHFFENPDISKHSLAEFFKQRIKSKMAAFGGSMTTNAPFLIPSPAPYITSILGIGNPYDC